MISRNKVFDFTDLSLVELEKVDAQASVRKMQLVFPSTVGELLETQFMPVVMRLGKDIYMLQSKVHFTDFSRYGSSIIGLPEL